MQHAAAEKHPQLPPGALTHDHPALAGSPAQLLV
jgi:hypothetical protein